VVIFVSATLASIGAAGIPSAGLVTLLIVLRAVDLPTEGIGLVFAIDRVVDMCRTTVNVFGDAVGAAVIARTEGENF
jgi:Na+/H+-dicarboxylate symporter